MWQRFKITSELLRASPPDWLYWILLASVFTRAIILRVHLPLDPIADPDTWTYLSPAIGTLVGTGWEHHLRSYIYPGFLFLLLRTTHDFRSIPIAQHLAGLLAAAIFLLVWEELRDLTRPSPVPKFVHRIIGLCGVAIYLFTPHVMVYEASIRPEGIVSLFVILNVWLTLKFCGRTWLSETTGLPVKLGAALVTSTIVLSMLKPSFVIAALGSLVPIARALSQPFPENRKRVLVLTCCIVTAGLLLPEQVAARHDLEGAVILPTQLFMTHAPQMHNQILTDLQSNGRPPYDKEWLARIEKRLAHHLRLARRNSTPPNLGFSPDYLMFGPMSFNAEMHALMQGDLRALAAFYRRYYFRVWLRHPVDMLRKITTQMSIFYTIPCPAYGLQTRWSMSEQYAHSLAAFHHDLPDEQTLAKEYPPLGSLLQRTAALAQAGLVLRTPSHNRESQTVLAKSFTGTVLTTFICGGFVLLYRRSSGRLQRVAALSIFLCWYNFANCLVVATVHSLEYARYSRVQLIFTILAEIGALWLFVEVLFTTLPRLLAKGSVLAGGIGLDRSFNPVNTLSAIEPAKPPRRSLTIAGWLCGVLLAPFVLLFAGAWIYGAFHSSVLGALRHINHLAVFIANACVVVFAFRAFLRARDRGFFV